MDCETRNKLQLLSLYLQNLPETIPYADPSSPQYSFDFNDEKINDYGPIGALNRELEVRMGQRNKGPISFKECGPSLNVVTNVLGDYLDQYHESPETVLLIKWVDDLTIAAVAAFKSASIEDPCHLLNLAIKDICLLPEFAEVIQSKHFDHQCALLNIGRGLEGISDTRFSTLYWAALLVQRGIPAFQAIIEDESLGIEIKGNLNELFVPGGPRYRFEMDLPKFLSVVGPWARGLKLLNSTMESTCQIGNGHFDELVNETLQSHDLYVTTFVLNPVYRNAPIYKQVNPMAGPTLTITKSVTGVITCATKPPQDMVTRAALALQRILRREYGDSYEAGKYPDPVVEMKLHNPMLAEFSPTDALVSFCTQFKAYIKGEDPFNQKMRMNESVLGWWKALQKDELANVLAPLAIKAFSVSLTSMPDERTMSMITWLNSPRQTDGSGKMRMGSGTHGEMVVRHGNYTGYGPTVGTFPTAFFSVSSVTPQKLKTPYKPLIKWCDMESTILGKCPAEDLPLAGRMPPPPEARTVDSDSDSEDEFDDGADWLDGPAVLSEFKTAEKDSFVLAASSSIDLHAPYLRELLDLIGKQPSHLGSAPIKKAAAKNLSSSVPDPSAWDEWK
ncbi:uncharacterized protein EDB91DRAFT_1293232 [Suillus paluster]|uniref:uncharacterized protein n=1 Tax=Suillus paluster TaxID=48578 RepID=UPI001B85FA15|nr:uncharacterized protein EDB91DRAFT_1293232 [Suillus paluster]KAG1752554.1 hypothetical protein EDB91DRAFT_1293232 [Suillus paluster]